MRWLAMTMGLVLCGCAMEGAPAASCGEINSPPPFGVVYCGDETASIGRWSAWCTGGSVDLAINPSTLEGEATCSGRCEPISGACRMDEPLCPDGLAPVCVLPTNLCDVAPESDLCTGPR